MALPLALPILPFSCDPSMQKNSLPSNYLACLLLRLKGCEEQVVEALAKAEFNNRLSYLAIDYLLVSAELGEERLECLRDSNGVNPACPP